MAEDLNNVFLVGRLTRDMELSHTTGGYPVGRLSLAVNRRRKNGEQWEDEANFFDLTLWGKRAEALQRYLLKGTQVAVQGQLRQDRWEQDGQKRSRVLVELNNIQLVGSRGAQQEGAANQPGYYGEGSFGAPPSFSAAGSNAQGGAFTAANRGSPYSAPPASSGDAEFEDDIPF